MKRTVAVARRLFPFVQAVAIVLRASPAEAYSHTRYMPTVGPLEWSAWLVSVPAQNYTPIQDAEDLLDTIGGDVIWVGKFDPATNLVRAYWKSGGECCVLSSFADSLSECAPSVEPACVGDCTCYSINTTQGPGFYVKVGPAGAAIVVTGRDEPLTIPLSGQGPGSLSGNQAISLPFSSPLENVGDLMTELGGTTNVATVGVMNSQTGAIHDYDGVTGVPFAIVPGEGYNVRLKPGVTLSYTPATVPPPKVKQRTYKIFGNVNTSAFAWELRNGTTVVCGNPAEPLVPGGSAVSIAGSLAGGITANTNCSPTYLSEANGDSVTIYGFPQLDLWIGSTSADCLVGFNGCSFNPTIYLVEESVPAIPGAGLALLVVSMLGAAYLILRSRFA